jgi:hypothetical protein
MSFDVLPHEVFLLILKAAPGAPHLRLVCWRWRDRWLEAGEGQADAWVADWRVTVASIPLAQLYIDLIPCKAWLCPAAAAAGRLDILQWARAHDCPWAPSTCEYAAAEGHLEILDWAVRNGCPPGHRAGIAAASRGRLEVLKWMSARSQALPWMMWRFGNCSRAAAKEGHFEVVVWAAANQSFGSTSYYDTLHMAAQGAARGGHLAILQWVAARCDSWRDTLICTKAAKGGHLEVLRWAHEQRCDLGMPACFKAAQAGHTEVFRWTFSILGPLFLADIPWDGFEPGRGRLGILQWVYRNQGFLGTTGAIFLLEICEAAVRREDDETLQWIIAHGSQVHQYLRTPTVRRWLTSLQAAFGHDAVNDGEAHPLCENSALAIMRGDPATVRWLAGRCNVNEAELLELLRGDWDGWPATLTLGEGTARRQRLLGMLGWWARHSNRLWSFAPCILFATVGDLELLQWARALDFPWNKGVCMRANVHGHTDVLAWAHAHGCPCKHNQNT